MTPWRAVDAGFGTITGAMSPGRQIQLRDNTAATFQKRHFWAASEYDTLSGLSTHAVGIVQALSSARRQTERQRFAEFTDLGGLAEYAIDVRRNVTFRD